MFHCHVCGNTTAKSGVVSEVFMVEERRVLVEQIRAQVCARCGETAFSREIMEKIRQLVQGAARPAKTVPLDVFALT